MNRLFAAALRFFRDEVGQRALRTIRRAGNVDIAFSEAQLLHRKGRIAEAQARYEQIVGQRDHAPSLHFLGVCCFQLGQLERAERLIRRSIALGAEPEYYCNLNLVLDAQGRSEEALDVAREAVRCAPRVLQSRLQLGHRLADAGLLREAEEAYRSAVDIQPEDVESRIFLGVVLSRLGRSDEAVSIFRAVLEMAPDNADALNNLGLLLAKADCSREAEAAYRAAILAAPLHAEAHCNLGALLADDGRLEEAEAAYQAALEVAPGMTRARINLGILLASMGRLAEAESTYRSIINENPGTPDAYLYLANLLRSSEREAEAENAYRRTLELRPDDYEASSNLASLLHEEGRFKEAEMLFRHALAVEPCSAVANYNLGGLLLDQGIRDEAEICFRRALELQPGLAAAHNRIGTLFRETGRFEEAERAYRRALILEPEATGVMTNLALLLHEQQRLEEAERYYQQALSIDPEHVFLRYNFGLNCLAQGRFTEGWAGYEYRWKTRGFEKPRHQSKPLWDGEYISEGSLLVWQEQGVGDVVLYSSMISDVLSQVPRLVLECENRLVPLMKRSFPEVFVVPREDVNHPVVQDSNWQCPIGSLGQHARPSLQSFRGNLSYLKADPRHAVSLRSAYREGNRPVIGLSWRSSNKNVGSRKSLPIAAWFPILSAIDATFVNLQYGDCAEELLNLEQLYGVRVLQDKTIDPVRDLDAFAAQVSAMDLVISISNSTVHFAGALGVPVWTLLPMGDALLWYWFHGRDDSPWYPSMRLYRQTEIGDWERPLHRIRDDLHAHFSEAKS